MSIEAALSFLASWLAGSPALPAFGGDSAVELLWALVVLWRFHANASEQHAERRAARIAGVLLFALAACVLTASAMTLLGYGEPKPTLLRSLEVAAANRAMMYQATRRRAP